MFPEIATTTVLDVAHTLSTSAPSKSSVMNFSVPSFAGMTSLEWVFSGFAVAFILYGMTIGRERLVAMMMATYITALTVQSVIRIPYIPSIDPLMLLIGWLVLFVIVVLILTRTRAADIVTLFDGSIVKRIIFVLLNLGFLTSVVYQVVPSILLTAPEITSIIFAGPIAHTVWVIVPLLSLLVIRGRIGRFDL